MSRKNAQTFAKRQREQLKQQKRQAKSDKKALRKAERERERGETTEPGEADPGADGGPS